MSNVVDANLTAAEAPKASGEAFNIACGERLSILDIVERLEQILGRSLPRRHTPPRPGDVRDTLADISRARASLGYVPAVDFAEGLRRAMAVAV